MPGIKMIALSFGYVESLRTSYLIFWSLAKKKPQTKKEAIESLAEFLYQKYIHENSPLNERNKCKYCDNYVGKEAFCPKCGRSLKDNPIAFDWDDWIDYLNELHSSDCDSYGWSVDIDNPYRWDPNVGNFEINKDEYIHVIENGAHILSCALSSIRGKELGVFVAMDYFKQDYNKLIKEKNGPKPTKKAKL